MTALAEEGKGRGRGRGRCVSLFGVLAGGLVGVLVGGCGWVSRRVGGC